MSPPRKVAFAAVVLSPRGYGVVIVEENIAGYTHDSSEGSFDTWEAAKLRADAKNTKMNIDAHEA